MQRKSSLLILGLSFLWTVSAAAAPSEPMASRINVGSEMRIYWTYVPSGMEKTKPAPLLFVLHGSAGSGEDMMAVTQRGFERIADKEKLIVVYPDALERRWNEQDGTVDDAAFLLAVADKLISDGLVDRKRVYMAGISNGGMMAQRMACEHADRVAGIASVAGSLPEKLAGKCKPLQPVPVILIHGTEDPIVLWRGGAVAGFEEFGKVLPALETAGFWATNNRCRSNTVSVSETDRDPKDGTRVRLELFPDCAANADVSMVTVEGGGHTWPGGYQYLPERFIGRTSRDIDANQIIWNFFRRAAR